MNQTSENQAVGTGLSCLAKLVILFIGLPILLIICVVTWWLSRQSFAQGELDRRVAQLAADGMPVDDTSMQIYYSQQTNSEWSDAWVDVLQRVDHPDFLNAAKDLPIFGPSADPIPQAGQAWSQKDAVGRFLEDQSLIIAQIDEMAPHLVRVRLPVQFTGPNTILEDVQRTRTVARLMRLRHELALHENDREEATRSVLGTLATARSLEAEPFLVAQLVGVAIKGVALEQLRKGLRQDIYSSDQLQRIAEKLDASAPSIDGIKSTLIGERALVLMNMQVISQGGSVPAGLLSIPHNSLASLDMFDRALEDLSSIDGFDIDALMQIAQRLEGQNQVSGWLEQLDTGLADMLSPSISASFGAFAREAMNHRIARLAVELRQIRGSSDAWPASLEQAAQESAMIDLLRPLGDKPFGYRINTDGSLLLWGFPIQATQEFQAMTETPDEPPIESDPESNWWLYQLSSPKSME